jgi:N-acetyl-gamma-glutamyl-phosphate/LysW-gamma-L-alpha-aminoadipyl-6-phosphate reductase
MSRTTLSIVGASGYAGGEMLRLALAHPQLEVRQVTSERNAGTPVALVHPNLRDATRLRFQSLEDLDCADVIVAALPHGTLSSQYDFVAGKAGILVDLSADFRVSSSLYERYYGRTHLRPELLSTFVLAIPELYRNKLVGASRISGVGCIATATILALHPLIGSELIKPTDVIVEAKIGSSAAGNRATASGHHPERMGVIRTYAPTGHRHEAEINQALAPGEDTTIHLTATAVERVRGILITAHLFAQDGVSDRDLDGAFRTTYSDEPFVRYVRVRRGIHRVPDPKVLDGTNFCDIGFQYDENTGRVVVMSAIDNLVKGTAGHALQALNISKGWDEGLGLGFQGLHP